MKHELFRGIRSEHENLTQDNKDARFQWSLVEGYLTDIGRGDILEHPTVLDVGGGTAEMSAYLNKKEGWTCVSVDDDTLLPKKEGAPQVTGDVGTLPFADASFEIIYEKGLFDANLYKMNWSKIIPELHRVLKPKGILCIVGFDVPPAEELEKLFTLLNPEDSLPLYEKKPSQ